MASSAGGYSWVASGASWLGCVPGGTRGLPVHANGCRGGQRASYANLANTGGGTPVLANPVPVTTAAHITSFFTEADFRVQVQSCDHNLYLRDVTTFRQRNHIWIPIHLSLNSPDIKLKISPVNLSLRNVT